MEHSQSYVFYMCLQATCVGKWSRDGLEALEVLRNGQEGAAAFEQSTPDGWLSKLWSPFGYPNYWGPYYNRDPKRDHNFDNHPDLDSKVELPSTRCTAICMAEFGFSASQD